MLTCSKVYEQMRFPVEITKPVLWKHSKPEKGCSKVLVVLTSEVPRGNNKLCVALAFQIWNECSNGVFYKHERFPEEVANLSVWKHSKIRTRMLKCFSFYQHEGCPGGITKLVLWKHSKIWRRMLKCLSPTDKKGYMKKPQSLLWGSIPNLKTNAEML